MGRGCHLSLQSRGTLTLPAALRKRQHLDEPGAHVRVADFDGVDGFLDAIEG